MLSFIRESPLCSSVFLCGFFALSFDVHAEVKAKDAWVRATVPAQKATGAFVTLTSSAEAKVVGASSPFASRVELHSSSMADGVMRMRAMDEIALPAGQAVELKPGGIHVMLMGLSKAVKTGDKVPIVFVIVDRDGKRSTLQVDAAVRPIASR